MSSPCLTLDPAQAAWAPAGGAGPGRGGRASGGDEVKVIALANGYWETQGMVSAAWSWQRCE